MSEETDSESAETAPRQPKGWTVGDLRAALKGVPDDMEITVRGDDGEGDQVLCGGIIDAHATSGCDGVPFFAIEATEDLGLLEASREDVEDVE